MAQWVKVFAMHAWKPDPTVGRKNGLPNSSRETDEQENYHAQNSRTEDS